MPPANSDPRIASIDALLDPITDDIVRLPELHRIDALLSAAADQHSAVLSVWQAIERRQSASVDPEQTAALLKCACFLFRHFIAVPVIRAKMLADPSFQALLQTGFVQASDAAGRRHAEHIMRQLFLPADVAPTTNGAWKAFFVVSDTLNDTDVHLCLPALELLRDDGLAALPFGWRWALLAKVLRSTANGTVRLKVLRFALDHTDPADLLLQGSAAAAALFRPAFVDALNATALYDDAEVHIDGAALRAFLLGSTADAGVDYLRLLADTNWLIVPLYHVTAALAADLVRDEHRTRLKTMLGRLDVQPNVHLRQAIVERLLDEFVQANGAHADEQPVDWTSNACLDALHARLCKSLRALSSQLRLTDDWQRRLRDALADEASAYGESVAQYDRFEQVESLFLARLPAYAQRADVLAGRAVRRLLERNGFDAALLALADGEPRLALSMVRFADGASIADPDVVLGALWPQACRCTGVELQLCVRWFAEVLERLQASDGQFGVWLDAMADSGNRAQMLLAQPHLGDAKRLLLCGRDEIVFDALVHGPKLIGDQIVEYDLIRKINRSHGRPTAAVDSALSVRQCALRLLTDERLLTTGQGVAAVRRIHDRCLREVQHIYKSRPRHYAQSQTHLRLFRLLQALALTSQTGSQSAATDYAAILIAHNHQPGVVHLLELLVGRSASVVELIALLAQPQSANARRSLIVCLAYASHRQQPVDRSPIADVLLPLAMGKDYATRLLAQFVAVRLLAGEPSLAHIVRTCERSLLGDDHRADYARLCADFRFAICDGDIEPLTLIAHDIPLLTGMASTECPDATDLQAERSPDDRQLRTLTARFAVPTRAPSTGDARSVQCTPVALNVDNVQRKIVPLRQLFAASAPDDDAPRPPARAGLVVVASLLTKHANLGGLARTCEIFGAEALVLDNLNATGTREFQALSMTADKWLLISEVRAHHLLAYMRHMRSLGYRLLGAEQTTRSVPIERYAFPAKALLLLGNEKHGIPIDLLSLLDDTLEVPQFGVVRSLNVHVAGALFVWEYAKQHRTAQVHGAELDAVRSTLDAAA